VSLSRFFRRAGEVSIGHTFIQLEEYVFDFALYPYMLYSGGEAFLRITKIADASPENGFKAGFAIMFACSVAFNYLYVRAYDRMKVDWFGIEAVRSYEPSWVNRLPPLLRIAARYGTFAGLSVWTNPLFAVLWLRSPGVHYEMARGDWGVFAVAIILANIGWTFLIVAVAWIIGFFPI
jgi:hypothetical protein